MSRLARTLLSSIAVAAVFSAIACSGQQGEIAADRPWEVMPADVVGIAHLDMQSLMQARLVQSVSDQFSQLPVAAFEEFEQFKENTGFDPQTDLESITLGAGYEPLRDDGPFFMVIKGNFDLAQIDRYAGENPDIQKSSHEDLTTYVGRGTEDGSVPTTFAWLDENTMIASSEFDFPRFAQSIAGDGRTVADSPLGELAARHEGQAWFALEIPDEAREEATQGAPGMAAMMGPLLQVESVLISANMTADLDLSISAMTGTDAAGEMVHGALEGFMVMAKMAAAENPETAELMNSLKLERDDKVIKLSLAVTGEQVESAFEQAPLMAALAGAGFPFGTSQTTELPFDMPESEVVPSPAPDAGTSVAPAAAVEPDLQPFPETVTSPVTAAPGQTIDDGNYESAVGRLVSVTDANGLDMTVELIEVAGDTLTFRKGRGATGLSFSMDRSEIETFRIVR